MVKGAVPAWGVATIDVWLGDFNSYGATAPQNCDPEYVISLAEPTSGFGADSNGHQHYPLDKIVVRSTTNVAQRGRIIPKSVAQINNPGKVDLVESGWAADDQVPSDHLPVYIDTNAVAALAPPPPPVAVGPAPGSKRFNFPDDPDKLGKKPKTVKP